MTILEHIVNRAPKILEKILDLKISLEFRDENKNNIAHYACKYLNYELVKKIYFKKNNLLCKRNILFDRDISQNTKYTPIDLLLENYRKQIFKTMDYDIVVSNGDDLLNLIKLIGKTNYCEYYDHDIHYNFLKELIHKQYYGENDVTKKIATYNYKLLSEINSIMFQNHLRSYSGGGGFNSNSPFLFTTMMMMQSF